MDGLCGCISIYPAFRNFFRRHPMIDRIQSIVSRGLSISVIVKMSLHVKIVAILLHDPRQDGGIRMGET